MQAWRGESQKGHLPPVCSVRMPIIRSTLPSIARWIITGIAKFSSVPSSPQRYLRSKRRGSWKSSWTVAHWCTRLSASKTLMSIFGP